MFLILSLHCQVFNGQKQCFCSKNLDLRHFCRKRRENLKKYTLRIIFKSGLEDSPRLLPSCSLNTLAIMYKCFSKDEGKTINKLKGSKACSYNVWCWYKNVALFYLPWGNAEIDCGEKLMSSMQMFVPVTLYIELSHNMHCHLFHYNHPLTINLQPPSLLAPQSGALRISAYRDFLPIHL